MTVGFFDRSNFIGLGLFCFYTINELVYANPSWPIKGVSVLIADLNATTVYIIYINYIQLYPV